MEENIKVDILPYTCVAFACNSKIYPLIDAVYEKKKEIYHDCAVESEHYHTAPITAGTPLQIDYARKMLGILLYYLNADSKEEQRTAEKEIEEMLKRGFPYCYQYIKSCPVIRIDRYMQKILSKKRGLAWSEMLETDLELFVLLFGCKFLNKEIVKDKAYSFVISNLSMREKHDKGEMYRIDAEAVERYAKEGKKLKTQLELYNPALRNCEFVGQNKDLTESLFAFMCDLENVSILEILEETMDKKLVDETYVFVGMIRKMFKKNNETPEELKEASDNFISMIYFRAMLREYNKLKAWYLENVDAVYEKQKLQRQVDLLTEQLKTLQKAYNDLLAKQQQLQNTLHKLESELSKQDEDLQELYKLREVVFKENLKEEIPEKEQKIDTTLLKGKKVVVVGGMSEWCNRLKNYLDSSSIFLGAGRLNYDENTVFANADLVVFNTKYLSHSAYCKAINEVKKNRIPYTYVNNSNIDQTLKIIVEALKSP